MAKHYKVEQVREFTDKSKRLCNMEKTLKTIYHQMVDTNKKNVACYYFDEEGKIKHYKYSEYAEKVTDLAKRLSTVLANVAYDSVVALKYKNSPEWPLIFWAIAMTGHRPLLIDARLAKENTVNLAKQGKAVAIIANEAEEYDIPLIKYHDILNANPSATFVENWANHVLFCSSGTTGDAKILIWDGENIVHQILAAGNIADYGSTTLIQPGKIRNLAMIPLHHIFGFVAVFLWFSWYGKAIVYPASTATKDVLYAIRKGKCTHIFSVPLLWDGIAQTVKRSMALKGPKYEELLANMVAYNTGKISKKEAGKAASGLVQKIVKKSVFGAQVEYCISGGGYLSPSTQELVNGIGYPLYNGYGMTEIGVACVEMSPNISDRLLGSIGKPFYGFDFKVVDENGNPTDGEGELIIKSPTTHKAEIIGGVYKETEFVQDGYFKTGDIAIIKEDQRCYIKGRNKDVIIASNGENVFPDELEYYFKDIPHVVHLVIFGVQDGATEKITLVVQLDNTVNSDGLKEVKAALDRVNASLPSEKKVVDFFVYKKDMPLANGIKVKRAFIKKAVIGGSNDITGFEEKRTVANLDMYDPKEVKETLAKVKSIFASTLMLTEEQIDDDAIWTVDLGGDSMSYISMVSDLNDQMELEIPTEKLGKLGSVRDFAAEVLRIRHEGANDDKK